MLEKNLARVRQRIDLACAATGRDPADVRLLLATKQVPGERIADAVRLGATLIGENRVQELASKDAALSGLTCERHFIGHLQTNKVNQVLRYVSCIQSIDRVELADRVQHRLEAIDTTVDVLVQVNTSDEVTKGGVAPDDAVGFVREIAKRDRLRLRGFMTIGLPSEDPARVRSSYRMLREIRDDVSEARIEGVENGVLSMGMSGDLDEAIAEGSTMVRVGSAVFGSRTR